MDNYAEQAAAFLAAPEVMLQLKGMKFSKSAVITTIESDTATNRAALLPLVETLLRECAHQAAMSVYLTALTGGRVAERARCLEIAKAVTNNAAGDTTLGQAIVKRIEEGK